MASVYKEYSGNIVRDTFLSEDMDKMFSMFLGLKKEEGTKVSISVLMEPTSKQLTFLISKSDSLDIEDQIVTQMSQNRDGGLLRSNQIATEFN